MNAIIPINIAGLRVNNTDQSNVTNNFKGCTAVFDQMPYKTPENRYHNVASTGNHIYLPLEDRDGAQPAGPGRAPALGAARFLPAGCPTVHGCRIEFPPCAQPLAGNPLFQPVRRGPIRPRANEILDRGERFSFDRAGSRCRGHHPAAGQRALPANPSLDAQPFCYMGRVLDYDKWDPGSEMAADYLPTQTGADGKPLYLTAMGFTGPSFCAYYPECCSVFGFWDHFKDLPDVFKAINNNEAVRFKVSYQLIGWINEAASDPPASLNR
jgi:hypothetical protein